MAIQKKLNQTAIEKLKIGPMRILTLILFLCGSVSSHASEKIVITGSSTVAPLVMEMAKRFESKNPKIRIDVQTGGSSRGLADARQGSADIGMMSRELGAKEKDVQGYAIAKDGISLIVHNTNKVRSLTLEQIRNIYTGKIKNWQQVGGVDAPITVVNKAEGRSTLELFLSHLNLKSKEIKPSIIIGDNEQGIKTVAGNPHAIGYVSIGSAESSVHHGVKVKLLSMGDVQATTENVRKGKFPLSRSLILVLKELPKGNIKKFLEFAQSEEVYDLIEEQYFVPIRQ